MREVRGMRYKRKCQREENAFTDSNKRNRVTERNIH